ncbi:transcriptional regulator [Burkholderia latens]|uniref:transcriptional regulator n=1 Tax=Burkholderia latens TaxID=488446 RepID=UPI001AE1903E|nr:transcriptional regulator [Burkholderia latens]QTO42801.1 transcriptional regulator [Burkholderia latens]
MKIGELLDAAKRKQGSLGSVAKQMDIEQSRLSKWRAGLLKPDAAQVMLLAEMADLPPFETLAQIEQELDAKNASVWARALGNLRAAGVAATVILGLSIYSTTPKEASAAETNFLTTSPTQPAPAKENGDRTPMIMSNKRFDRKQLGSAASTLPDTGHRACTSRDFTASNHKIASRNAP